MKRYIILFIFGALSANFALAQQVRVFRNGAQQTGSYTTVYDAYAATQAGDEIRVSGTTTERRTIHVTHSVTITNGTNAGIVNANDQSITYPTRVTSDIESHADGTDNRCLFKISGTGTVLTLKGNVTYNGGTNIDISLFRVQENATLIIDSENVTIQNSHGAIMAKNDGAFEESGAVQFHAGGGIWINGGDVELRAGTITNNDAQLGGGIFISNDHGTLTMTGGKITGNHAIYKIENGAITYVPLGGGIFVATGHGSGNTKNDIVISGGEISNNHVDKPVITVDNKTNYSCGGGICAKYAWVVITGGKIINNSAPNDTDKAEVPTSTVYKSNGGGISMSQGGKLTISGSPVISGNSAERGGAIHLSGDTIADFSNITINGNKCTVAGGGLFIESSENHDPLFTFDGVTFTENQALGGGGGAINITGCQQSSVVDGCTFISNYSRYRGGAILLDYTNEASFHINGITTNGNNSANDEWTYLNHGGNVIAIMADELKEDTKYPTILVSGDFDCDEEDEIFLFGKTYLTNYVADGYPEFTVADEDGKIDILLQDKDSYQHIFNGRDILASFDNASKVDAGDLDKLNVKVKNPYDEKYGSYLSAKYDANGFDRNVYTQKDVIELRCLGMIRISRSGLKKGESAIYNVFAGNHTSMPSSDPMYTVQLTGIDNDGTTVSREILYLANGDYTVFENAWDWTYATPVAYKQNNVVDKGEGRYDPVPWTLYDFTGAKLENVPVKPYDEAFDGDKTGKYQELTSSEGGIGGGGNVNL